MNEYVFTATIALLADEEDSAHINFRQIWRRLTPKQVFELFELSKTVSLEHEMYEEYEEAFDDLPF